MSFINKHDQLYALQVRREEDAIGAQSTAYWSKLHEQLTGDGNAAHHAAGRLAFNRLVTSVVPAFIEEFRKMQAIGNPRQHGFWMKYLRDLNPVMVAHETMSCLLIHFFGGEASMSLAAAANTVGRRLLEIELLEKDKANNPFTYARLESEGKKLCRSTQHRRNIFRERMKRTDPEAMGGLKDIRRLGNVGMICVEIAAANSPFFEKRIEQMAKNKRSIQISAKPDLYDVLYDKRTAECLIKPRGRMMVCEPRPWVAVDDGGYILDMRKKALTKGPYKMRTLMADADGPFHLMAKALDFYGRTPWKINEKVLAAAEMYQELDRSVGALHRQELLELVRFKDYPDTPEGLAEYRRVQKGIYDHNTGSRSSRLKTLRILSEAKDNAGYDSLYTPFMSDHRGRLYAIAGHSTQGNDLSRAMLEFRDGVSIVTEGHWRALKLSGASYYGYDKTGLEGRLGWFSKHEKDILASAADPIANTFWQTEDQKYVWRMLAFCLDFQRVVSGGLSHMPACQDCTSSGFQVLSALTRSDEGAGLVNLKPSDEPVDLYTKVAERAREIIVEGKPLIKSDLGEWAVQEIIARDILVSRKLSKAIVMPKVYGSRTLSGAQRIREELDADSDLKVYELDILKFAIAHTLAIALEQALDELMGPATEFQKWLSSVGYIIGKNELEPVLTMPDGFQIVISEREKHTIKIENSYIKRERFNFATGLPDKFNPHRYASTLPPNLVHALDATVLRILATKLEAHGITSVTVCHDDIGCHCIHLELVNRLYREAFLETIEKCTLVDQLYAIAKGADDSAPKPPAEGEYDLNEILTARYALS